MSKTKTPFQIDDELHGLIPPLTDEERQQLEANILADGCRDPLVTWQEEGILLDGHNRFAICKEHDIPFDVREISLPDRDAAKRWVILNQRGRRNISPSVYAMLGAKFANLSWGQKKGEVEFSTSLNEAAHLFGVSRDYVIQACKVIKQGTSELQEAVMAGDVAVSTAAEISHLKANEQNEVIDQGAKAVIAKAKEVRAKRREKKRSAITVGSSSTPTGKYRVLYADPPWQYGNKGLTEYGHAESHYPTMPLADLCAMPVAEWAEDDAVLFLWATSPMLEDALKVITAWGFTYKTSMVWDKVKHNFGHYVSVRHEFLLIATRGSCTPDTPKLFDSVQTIERSAQHSEKPEEFRQIIETIYTHGTKLELFGRAKHIGWEVHGNQL